MMTHPENLISSIDNAEKVSLYSFFVSNISIDFITPPHNACWGEHKVCQIDTGRLLIEMSIGVVGGGANKVLSVCSLCTDCACC